MAFNDTGVVGVNNSGLFDSELHTQGGMSHLMQFLWDEYIADLRKKIEAREEAGKKSVTLQEAVKRSPATAFIKFASDYLAVNRPTSTFFIDQNIGLSLRNQKHMAIAPGVEIRGTMQDAGAIGVTQGISQEGLEGAINDDNIDLRI